MLAVALLVLLAVNTWAYWSLVRRADKAVATARDQAAALRSVRTLAGRQSTFSKALSDFLAAQERGDADGRRAALERLQAASQPGPRGPRGEPGASSPPSKQGTSTTTTTTRPPTTTTTAPCVVPTVVGLPCVVRR